MALTVTAGTAVNGSGTNSLTCSPVAPTNVTNDILVALIAWNSGQTMSTVPAGWTALGTNLYDSNTSGQVYTAPAGTVTTGWVISGSSSSVPVWGQIFCVDNGGSVITQDTFALVSVQTNHLYLLGAALTTIKANELLLGFALSRGVSSLVPTVPTGFTAIGGGALAVSGNVSAAYDTAATAGLQTAPEWTYVANVIEGATILIAFMGGALPPTVNAGAPQTVAADTAVTLTGTDTFAAGHSGTVAWTVVTGGAPAITAGSTTLSATIANSGGLLYVPTTYTYELTVTQDDAQTAVATTTVTVNPPPMFRASGGDWTALNPVKRASGGTWFGES